MQVSDELRIKELKARLRARQGRPEYRDNIPALEAEIARLESRLRERGDE
jgi:aminoglycoside/choline kinase family phosphotransferase